VDNIEHIVKEEGHPSHANIHKLALELCTKHVSIAYKNKILDIGAGMGEFTDMLWYSFPDSEIRFNEPNDTLREILNQKTAGAIDIFSHSSPVEQMQHQENYFDLVTMLGVIEHCESPIKALRQIHRVLKPKGTTVIVTPNLGRPRRFIKSLKGEAHVERSGHFQGWDYHLFKQVLEVVGFRDVEIYVRFVDLPGYKLLPSSIADWLSFRVLRKWCPMLGSELYAVCRK